MGLDDFVTDESVSSRKSNSTDSKPELGCENGNEISFYPRPYSTNKLENGLWEVVGLENRVVFDREYFENALDIADFKFNTRTRQETNEIIYYTRSEKDKFELQIHSSIIAEKDKAVTSGPERILVKLVEVDSGRPVLPSEQYPRTKDFRRHIRRAIKNKLTSKKKVPKCSSCSEIMVLDELNEQLLCKSCSRQETYEKE